MSRKVFLFLDTFVKLQFFRRNEGAEGHNKNSDESKLKSNINSDECLHKTNKNSDESRMQIHTKYNI